ncbi:MAG: TonB-dependent receptor domain-containing protein [Bacteroidota bacterium]|jgi:TonB-dependent receptor
MSRVVTILILLIFSLNFKAQNGKLVGKVIDGQTGETLPGAAIVIEGTTIGAASDFDGNFSLGNLKPGKYTILSSYISYDNKKFIDVVIKADDVTTLNIALEQSSSATLNTVEIQAEMNKENINTLFIMQKNNASVSDGISSESIKKTPDRNTSDVLKRISGASIQDNKFAIIRGMSDRYNSAYLNGSPLPSSESDKRAFAFDIFPSAILDNLVILKTATPDLPGDFAGGVILINTKNIPDKNSTNISIGTGYNTLTTFKDFKTYKGSKTDWLGVDNGSRQLPASIPSTENFSKITNNEKIDYAKDLNYDWTLQTKKALPNLNVQLINSSVFKLFKKDFGSVVALTYNISNATTISDRREFEEQGETVLKVRDFKDTTYSNNILTSLLWNLSYKLNDNNQIGFKNLYSINTDDKTISRQGLSDAGEITKLTWQKSNVRFYTQNNIYSGQLNGDHYIPKGKIKIKWIGGISDIKRDIPNLRRMVYEKNSKSFTDSVLFNAIVTTDAILPTSAGSMFFSKTKESIYSIKYDASKVFETKNTKHDVKIGGFNQLRTRDFSARLLGYTRVNNTRSITNPIAQLFNTDLLILDESQIFSQQNIGIVDGPGSYVGGFKLSESTTYIDSYQASSVLNAGYLMSDSRFFNKLRFIYGLRVESYLQSLSLLDTQFKKITKDTTFIDFLPSINAVWSLNDQTNFRAAYYRTVNRPEFRELANFNFYDFVTDYQTSGNPNLKRATINNYDLRFEYYPKKPGQIISVSAFYKDLTDAIEQVAGNGQIRSINYENVAKVTNYGFELEYRILLSSIFKNDSSKFLNGTTLFTNFSYIKSDVDVSKLNYVEARPLQGQSPVIINAGLQYLDAKYNFGISLSYNYVGRRIIIVGNTDEPNIWENPRHVLDIQLSKTFKEKIELKLNIRDALAQNLIFYQDINKNGKFDKISLTDNKEFQHASTSDNTMVNTRLAPTISFSISYKIN